MNYTINFIPESLKEIEQEFRATQSVLSDVRTKFYRIDWNNEKILLTDDNIKNLTEKTLEIFVELESMRINVFLFLVRSTKHLKFHMKKKIAYLVL